MGVAQLEYVKLAQQYWVEAGTNVDLCRHPKLRHNVSNTISVDNWDEVEQYIFDNRAFFAGISLLSAAGDRAYVQAPFAEVIDADQIMAAYGEGSLFASGLVVDALHAFNENLWIACDTAMGYGMKLDDENSSDILKRDWVRRAQKFANNYFDGDMQKMTFCLKDCYNLHKWNNIIRSIQPIEFAQDLSQKSFVDVDSLAGAACAGGVCEVVF
jgi:ribonucleoside-triphosphate reductase